MSRNKEKLVKLLILLYNSKSKLSIKLSNLNSSYRLDKEKIDKSIEKIDNKINKLIVKYKKIRK